MALVAFANVATGPAILAELTGGHTFVPGCLGTRDLLNITQSTSPAGWAVAVEGGSLGQTPSTPLARVVLAPVNHGLTPRPLKPVLAVTSGVAIIVLGAGPSVHACGVVAG